MDVFGTPIWSSLSSSRSILFNGCVLWDADDDAPIASRRLPRTDAVRLVEATIELGVHANVYIDRDLYVAHRGRLSLESEEKDGVPHTEVDDLVSFVRDHASDPFKLLCIDESTEFAELEQRFKSVTSSPCTIVNSEPTYLEVLPAGVHKGAMLDEIEQKLPALPDEASSDENAGEIRRQKRARPRKPR